jgi:hypothetical protein
MDQISTLNAVSGRLQDRQVATGGIKSGIKGFYDAMLEISIAASNSQNPDNNLGILTIGGRTYDFSDQAKLAGTIVLAEQDVNNFSQVIQFLLKNNVTYINDLFKQASNMI